METDLDKLLELARDVPVTEAERERQRRSFAYGNTNIENARITRATIDKAAERLEKTSPATKSK
jgi:hypothetical protein